MFADFYQIQSFKHYIINIHIKTDINFRFLYFQIKIFNFFVSFFYIICQKISQFYIKLNIENEIYNMDIYENRISKKKLLIYGYKFVNYFIKINIFM